MSEPGRISCCISGCRRTFKIAPTDEDDTEVMCAKHYRCDRVAVDRYKRLRAQVRKWHRICMKHAGPSTVGERIRFERMERIWGRWVRLCLAQWATIKAEAQRLQDAGYWAPRPSVRRNRTTEPRERKAADRFEAEFQRLKRAGAS